MNEAMSDYVRVAREALERAEKATEGPWRERGHHTFVLDGTVVGADGREIANVFEENRPDEELHANRLFIAHARQDVPDLAKAVLDQQAEIERLHIPKGMYEEMCAKFAQDIEKCVGKLRKAKAEIERLQSQLRIEKASQATRGNN